FALVVFGAAVPLAARDDAKKDDAKKDEPKKDEPKKDEPKKDDAKKDDEKLLESEYYPLAVGTEWTYDMHGGKVKVVVVEHEKFKGTLCARIESTPSGGETSSEHITIKEDGVYRCAYNGVKIDPP